MRKHIVSLIVLLSGIFEIASGEDFARHVDPFIGTKGTAHCYPNATTPFGFVQPGPASGTGDWAYTGGYQFEDLKLYGFHQNAVSGTGCHDLGDLLVQPFTGAAVRDDLYQFDKAQESASPGFYSVTYPEIGVKVEVTAAEHVSFYRFTFAKGGPAHLLLDLQWGLVGRNALVRHVLESDVDFPDAHTVIGHNRNTHWVHRDWYYAIAFNRAVKSRMKLASRDPQEKGSRWILDFDVRPGETVLMKIALSSQSVSGAQSNLAAEIPAWDFDAVKRAARAKWNEVMGRAAIEGADEQKKNWYTSLYHLFIQPNNIADVGAKPFYSTLSTWDTFRAAHPLYTILAPEKAAEFVDSMLEQGRRTGYLPIWTLWGKDNQCMIGTHSIPVIVDWFLKDFHCRKERKEHKDSASLRLCVKNKSEYWLSAYAQIKDTLTKPHKGRVKERWDLLDKYGYYPFDEIKGESVSRTMECAYDDWCAGVMAEKLGFKADAEFFFKRSENWRNVFDTSIGFVRGKDTKGNWREPYNPYALGHGAGKNNDFTEGNAFQYTWHVMQNPQGLVNAMGGRESFVKKLDSLFVAPSKTEGMGEVLDVTGLIGQYVHGNEPSHHVIYFYPQVGHPEKAAARIREVFDRFYLPKPDGLCGNDDCGQMSAWYVFSAMGFYPFNPCGGEYVIGAPQLPRVTLNLANGKMFTMTAKGLSRENKYVKSVRLNGKPVKNWKIHHSDIVRGGELIFEMIDAL